MSEIVLGTLGILASVACFLIALFCLNSIDDRMREIRDAIKERREDV